MPAEPPAERPSRYHRVGKYTIERQIAAGGMCAVYKAWDTELDRRVALKILPLEMAANSQALERFRREARHVARVSHENLVTIFEFGQNAGTFYLALEFVDGIDLHDYVGQRGVLAANESIPLILQAARALGHLHQLGMIHRDVKPSNLLLATSVDPPVLKLTDLGLARLVREDEFRVTQAGHTVGTLDFMAPEQARDSSKADIRSDIYSLGCTWYHLLAGAPPFAGGTLAERLYKHLECAPPELARVNSTVTPELERVLRKMLAKNPDDRYPAPADLARDLEDLTVGRTKRRRSSARRKPQNRGNKSRNGKPVTQAQPVLEPEQDILRGGAASPERRAVQTPHPAPRSPALLDTAHDVCLPIHEASKLPAPAPQEEEAAKGQFARAIEAVEKSNFDYGIHLLMNCCRLDPANALYRRRLREAEKAKHGRNRAGRPFAFLATTAARTRLKAAKAKHDHLKVLQVGEEILERNPWDAGTSLDMAESAEALGLADVAMCILEQAWDKSAPDLRVLRALAHLYERFGRLTQARACWDVVNQKEPTDLEAFRKIRDLSAAETIARGQYGALTPRQS
jgi:serine/threonine protein kinase